MESSSSNAEVVKPVLVKAGIALAISVAGYICARIIAKRSIICEASSMENPVSPLETDSQEEFRGEASHSSTSSTYREDEDKVVTCSHFMDMIRSLGIQNRTANEEEEIVGLRRRIEELQNKELEIERRFLHFCDLKEQESMLMELRNMLWLETLYVEFLDREISSMEGEAKRVKDIGMEYLRVVEQWKSQNGLLQRKVKRLLRKTKGQAKIIREKDLEIEAKDAEIRGNGEELEGQSNVIKKLEDQVRELKSLIDQLQEQKSELAKKLELAENSHSQIKEGEDGMVTIEEYDQLANEYERVQKERAAELKELIYLRWCNACLRYELKRYQLLQDYMHEDKVDVEQLDGEALMEQGSPCLEASNGGQVCSKRQKLLKKFKKWVEGNEKMKSKLGEKAKHESKCFGRHSAFDEVQGEHLIPARKSCSSV